MILKLLLKIQSNETSFQLTLDLLSGESFPMISHCSSMLQSLRQLNPSLRDFQQVLAAIGELQLVLAAIYVFSPAKPRDALRSKFL